MRGELQLDQLDINENFRVSTPSINSRICGSCLGNNFLPKLFV